MNSESAVNCGGDRSSLYFSLSERVIASKLGVTIFVDSQEVYNRTLEICDRIADPGKLEFCPSDNLSVIHPYIYICSR